MRRISLLAGVTAVLFGLSFVACGDDNGEDPKENKENEDPFADVEFEDWENCDPLMEGYCSMPWPSNQYLEEDAERDTGYTLGFGEYSLPESIYGYVEPEMMRRLDGYGLGTPVVVLFPGVDISGMPHELSIEDSVEKDDLDAFYFEVTESGLEPVPFFAELDARASNQEEQVLYLRPAVILEENARYVVGFRNLQDESGEPFERSTAFEMLLQGAGADHEALEDRQERFDEIFELLEDAGVDREELTLAWDFHTGSSDGLHGELLHIMEEGVEIAEQEGIEITITDVEANTPEEDEYMAYHIRGTFRVPHFLEESDRSGEYSYLFYRGEDGMPAQNGWREADFWLEIPHSAVDGTPHGLVSYGHGMLGTGRQVGGYQHDKIMYENNLIFFGASFIGFSTEDVEQAMSALQQPTYFEELVDRMHQGVLEYSLLTMAMRDGLAALPDEEMLEEEEDLELVVDEDRIYYHGISQGGIYGVTVLAVDPIIDRGHLGVPGNNYAVMMERSSNFAPYELFLRNGFPNRIDQSMAIPVIQLMWDKIDPISYLRRLQHEPFDPDRPKYGLFAHAKADWQVAVVTTEIMSRSQIGIPVLEPYDRERGTPWGVETASYPHTGSGYVLFDMGNPWPEPGNLPPDDELGDPHGAVRYLDEENEQMVHFFDEGEIIDVCGGDYCYFPPD